MSLSVNRRRSNKENCQRAFQEPSSLASTTKIKRNTDSVGRIVPNGSRRSSRALIDVTPHKNVNYIAVEAVTLKGSSSTAKKRLLEDKYRRMINQYEAKQKELDYEMKRFERSYNKAEVRRPARPAPIILTSEFNSQAVQPKLFSNAMVRPVVHLPIPVISHGVSRELTDDRARYKDGPRRHETEQKEDSDGEHLPYQQT